MGIYFSTPVLFYYYLLGDELADNAEEVIELIVSGELRAYLSSEAYDDAVAGL
ncbi:MAG: hypothetical protein J7L55_05835 [Desulfurococcales archaeon]|nr:hypothetical protein [Desulfurococcales archaeon]